jgi:hypothetical protein
MRKEGIGATDNFKNSDRGYLLSKLPIINFQKMEIH